jgi:uncharacterized protein
MAYAEQDWQQWRAERDARLRSPNGWLSLIGLHWLGAAPETFGTVPGRWSLDGDIVVLVASEEDGLTIEGEPAVGELRLKPSDPHVAFGARDIEIIKRADWYALRVRDPQAPSLTTFEGMPMFPFSTHWVVPAHFEAYAQAQDVTLGSVVKDLTDQEVAVGTLRFTVGGQDYALTAFDGGDGELDILFRDATSGVTTYAAMRSLIADKPGADGRVVLDFNRAYNMPCALTDFATCPLPPRENVLPLEITAGEQTLH